MLIALVRMATMATNETESRIVESIIDSIENNNVLPWHKPWDSVNGMPFNPITGSVYSGINRIILMMRGGDSRYATYNQISAKGGKVIKGSKGITLVYYSQGNTKVTTDANGDDVTVKGYAFARAFTVFNLVEHTTDLDLDTLGIDSTTSKVIGTDSSCDAVYQNMINKPNLYHGLNGAYYVPMTDSVHMPQRESFTTMQHYYATLFHELTHATGHKSRLDRLDNAARFGSDSYSKEELVADLGGYFICAHTGITNESIHNNSVAYLASWLKVLKSEPKILISAASQAQKAVDSILNRKP